MAAVFRILFMLFCSLLNLTSLPLLRFSPTPLSTTTSGLSSHRQRRQHHRCFSLLHSLHVALVLLLTIFLFCFWLCPYLTVHRLHACSMGFTNQVAPYHCIPTPPASVYQCLITIFHCCSLGFILL